MDLYSRRILGWAMDKRMTKELVISALQRAIDRQPPKEGLIHHSDRGTQYCSKAYRTLLHKHGIISSMSRKGNCYDNACIESFHSIIKKEWIFHENTVLELRLKKVFWSTCFTSIIVEGFMEQ